MYLPLAKAVLQELRTCSNAWGFSLLRGQVGSLSFFYLTTLLFDGSWSYVQCIKKLNLSGAICQMSFQVIDLCSTSSQLVHWPCWDNCAPFMSLLLSSSFLTSWMTLLRRSLLLACDHHFFSFTPKPCLPVWVRPITSLKARFSLALIVSLTFHFLPVFYVGFKDFITLSLESSSILFITHLSIKLFITGKLLCFKI